jgi:carboxypeptidase C (cathepsin A)
MTDRAWPAVVASLLMALVPLAAAGDAGPRSFTTRHQGVFNGTAVEYTATVGEFFKRDDKDAVIARLVATSYVREDVADRASRPVLFLWNGGPGAASLWLHFGAFGPKRVEIPADLDAEIAPPYRLLDNAHSVLDVADLVFVDPVGTGYSRRVGEGPATFTPATDAKSTADLIRAWVRGQGRESSPRYVLGESYGTIRAVLVAEELKDDLPLAGIYLFGQGVNLVETTQRAGNIVGYATNLPALAAIAWYHGRTHRRYRDVSQLIDEAWAFGMKDYLLALAQGDELRARERRRIARRLEELSGIPAEYYLENGLALNKQRFRREILKDRGLTVGFYDGRYTAPLPKADEPLPDPSMKFRDAFVALAPEHYKNVLAVALDEEYLPTDPQASSFNWDVPATIFADYDYPGVLTRTMQAQPCLRLAIGTGIYDTTTTVGPARYLVARSKLPRERVSLHQYEGGHMAYSNVEALEKMADDVRALVKPVDCR